MEIFRLLDSLPFVQQTRVILAEQDARRRHLKLQIDFTDGSILFTNEFLAVGVRSYSFHWQAADGRLLARWDNAPHHRTLPTFPHHVHLADRVEASPETMLEDVLRQIEERRQHQVS